MISSAIRNILCVLAVLIVCVILAWPYKLGISSEDYIVRQVGVLKSVLCEASEKDGVPQENFIASIPISSNGITSEIREIFRLRKGENLQRSFLKDRGGNDILIFRKEDLPKSVRAGWMTRTKGMVYVWGVGSNGRNEWGGGDDVPIDFDGLSVIREQCGFGTGCQPVHAPDGSGK